MTQRCVEGESNELRMLHRPGWRIGGRTRGWHRGGEYAGPCMGGHYQQYELRHLRFFQAVNNQAVDLDGHVLKLNEFLFTVGRWGSNFWLDVAIAVEHGYWACGCCAKHGRSSD